MKQKLLFLLAMLFCTNLQIMAQKNDTKPEDRAVDMDAPTFEPMVRVGKVLLDKDSIQYVQVNNVYVYPQQRAAGLYEADRAALINLPSHNSQCFKQEICPLMRTDEIQFYKDFPVFIRHVFGEYLCH